jgi:hypothetical protein
VIASLAARKLRRLRAPRAWAAIAFGETGLELATARAAAGAATVLQRACVTAPLLEQTGQAKPEWQTAAQSLRQQLDPREHRLATCIGCEELLCQTLELPATDPAELKQMLDLQIDNLTPLPLEEVVYGFEPLEHRNGQTRVLVAIARKDAVNERVQTLETAGLPPEIVSVDMLAVFRALLKRDMLPRDERLHALVRLGNGSATVVVHSRGVPLAVRSIAFDPNDESELQHQLQLTLVAAEAMQPQSVAGCLTFVVKEPAQHAACERIGRAVAAEVQLLDDGAVPSPALSLSVQCAEAGAAQLNLLPEEWRARRQAARRRRILVRAAIAAVAVYVAALAAFLSLLALRSTQLGAVEAEIRAVRAPFSEARQLHNEMVAMRRQLDTRYSALEVLRDIAMRMPENLKLNHFLYKKDQTVTLRGQAQSAALAYDFISRLEQGELFSSVKTVSVRTEGAGGLTKFEVLCTLKSATGGAASSYEH